MKFYTFATAVAVAIVVLAATETRAWGCHEWIWEDCSEMWYRDACEHERETECGWIYWDDWEETEFWVSCEEFAEWDWCN